MVLFRVVANSDPLLGSADYPSSNRSYPPKSSTGQVKTCHHSGEHTCLQRPLTEKLSNLQKRKTTHQKNSKHYHHHHSKKSIALDKLGNRSEALDPQWCFCTVLCCITFYHFFWFLLDAFRQLWQVQDWSIPKLTSPAASGSRQVLEQVKLCITEAHTLLIPLILL